MLYIRVHFIIKKRFYNTNIRITLAHTLIYSAIASISDVSVLFLSSPFVNTVSLDRVGTPSFVSVFIIFVSHAIVSDSTTVEFVSSILGRFFLPRLFIVFVGGFVNAVDIGCDDGGGGGGGRYVSKVLIAGEGGGGGMGGDSADAKYESIW